MGSTLLLGDRAFTGQSTGRMNHEIIRILTELPLILKREDKEKAAKSKQNESAKQNEANKEKRPGTQKPPFLKKTISHTLKEKETVKFERSKSQSRKMEQESDQNKKQEQGEDKALKAKHQTEIKAPPI